MIEPVGRRAVELLQQLLRFDTRNPPGNERACIEFIRDVLVVADVESTIVGQRPDRPNLVARIPGRGLAAPILVQGHVDVVGTSEQVWSRDPFGGEVADGEVWGRGALDMKGGVAMMLAAIVEIAQSGSPPPADIVFAALADEESISEFGAAYLVKHHPELFRGVRYSIGEVGGFNVWYGDRPGYLVQVAEKRTCHMQLVVRGPAGHAAVPIGGTAVAVASRLLVQLTSHRLPTHATPATIAMLDVLDRGLPVAHGSFSALLGAEPAESVLTPFGAAASFFDAMLRNTATPTIVDAGVRVNVIPSEVRVNLNGRLLPGFFAADLVDEIRGLLGDDGFVIEVGHQEPPGPLEPDLGLLPLLTACTIETHPSAVVTPFLMPAGTDGRFFGALGIQSYGFVPLHMPEGSDFWSLCPCAR